MIKNVESFYLEKKKTKSCRECLLIIKSMSNKSELFKFINNNHKYKIPFIAKIKLKSVNNKYLNWAKLIT